MRSLRALTLCAIATALSARAHAATVPTAFSVQGVLRDSGGVLQSMTVNITVKLFAAQTGGTALATPVAATPVMATNGLFTLAINVDSTLANVLTTTPQVWLELTANADVFPRQPISADVYSLYAGSADALSSACSGCVADSMLATGIAAAKISGKVAACTAADSATNSANLGGVPATSYVTQTAGDARYLAIAATAADSAKLGGVAAASYMTQTAGDARYLAIAATAADSAKLGGVPAASYMTQTAGDARYLAIAATAADSAKLGGVAATSYLQKSGNGSLLTNLNGGAITGNTIPAAALVAGALTHAHSIGVTMTGENFTALDYGGALGVSQVACSPACPAGYLAVGGTCRWSPYPSACETQTNFYLQSSYVDSTQTEFCCRGMAKVASGLNCNLSVSATCVRTSSGSAL